MPNKNPLRQISSATLMSLAADQIDSYASAAEEYIGVKRGQPWPKEEAEYEQAYHAMIALIKELRRRSRHVRA